MLQRHHRAIIIIACAACLLTVAALGYWGAYSWAQHGADRVTITARHGLATDPSHITYHQTVADAARVHQLQAWISDDLTSPGAGYSGLGGDQPSESYDYLFVFSWRGLVIESASISTIQPGLWHVSILGYSNGGRVNASASQDVYAEIVKAMPALPAPEWARQSGA